MQEVRGSIPLGSTNTINDLAKTRAGLFDVGSTPGPRPWQLSLRLGPRFAQSFARGNEFHWLKFSRMCEGREDFPKLEINALFRIGYILLARQPIVSTQRVEVGRLLVADSDGPRGMASGDLKP
jgi:hypothetical protein